MTEDKEKVYEPETIPDQSLPGEEEVASVGTSTRAGETHSPTSIKEKVIAKAKVARVLVSESLDTLSKRILGVFEFGKSGAIQIGEQKEGESGDIRISANGFLARNQAGETTVGIDGSTGNATFKGTVQAGSIISESELIGGSVNINDRFLVDEEGKVTIKDDVDTTIIDAKGLVSTASFVGDTVSKNADQTFNNTNWTDISSLTLSFTLARAARVLFMATVTGYYNAMGGQLQVRFNLNGNGVGPLMGFGYVDTAETVSAQFIIDVPAGSNIIKLQARDDGLGGSSGVVNATRMPAVLNYVILGK